MFCGIQRDATDLLHSSRRLRLQRAARGSDADERRSRRRVHARQITVTAPREHEALSDNVIANEEMWRFNLESLDQAVKLVPGVSATFDTKRSP